MATPFATPSPRAQAPSQVQMFYQAHREVSAVNDDFMWLVQNGMTREDLARCIQLRPSLWSRFEGFLAQLPSREAPAPVTH